MKKIFTQELIGQFILNGILIGVVLFFLHGYYQKKWAPLTAAETLKKENFLNSKRDTYFQAIDILNRNLANSEFTINGIASDTSNRKRGGSYPTELEINSCFSKLCIYSDDEKIPLTFYKLFDTNDKNLRPILEMSIFINLVRKDLGYGNAIIDTTLDRYRFIQVHRKSN
ncbi:MAG TPA: hypothetical protein PK275_08840 [Chitinophagaceae bacterium]|nr:hypothetical protein [Chitinophagaceae bacterium]